MSVNATSVESFDNYTNWDLSTGLMRGSLTGLLTPTMRLIVTSLATYYNNKTKIVFPSLETLARNVDVSIRSASRSIDALIKQGLILKTKRGKHNVYRFTNKFFEGLNENASKTNKLTKQKPTSNTGQFVKDTRQNRQKTLDKLSSKQNKYNKINNNNFFQKNSFKNSDQKSTDLETFKNKNHSDFQKPKYWHNTQTEGVNYLSPEKTKKQTQKSLYVDDSKRIENSNREQALLFCKNLLPESRIKSIIFNYLMEKWNFSAEEIKYTKRHDNLTPVN